jgi:hypothetical protein
MVLPAEILDGLVVEQAVGVNATGDLHYSEIICRWKPQHIPHHAHSSGALREFDTLLR